MRLPRLFSTPRLRLGLVQQTRSLVVLCVGLCLAGCDSTPSAPRLAINGSSADGYLFCFWNVENLFDDRDDQRTGQGDKEYDPWLARNPDVLQLKLSKLTEALLKLNGGKGPDIFAMCEVESVRAAELLQQALNARLDPSLHYTSVLMNEVKVGRHIAPAILTRLPVVKDRTRGYGARFRIIEGHIEVDGHKLIVLAAHWTSRLQKENEKGRHEYADKLYGAANAMYKSDPDADVLICGDFNDTPDDPAVVQSLHASGDEAAVRARPPHLALLNLMANKDAAAGFGTHFYNRWMIFDHIVVAPGLLDTKGWSCEPKSLQVVQTLTKPGDTRGRPWRFGGEKDSGPRGYSDHFPVTVRLKVQR